MFKLRITKIPDIYVIPVANFSWCTLNEQRGKERSLSEIIGLIADAKSDASTLADIKRHEYSSSNVRLELLRKAQEKGFHCDYFSSKGLENFERDYERYRTHLRTKISQAPKKIHFISHKWDGDDPNKSNKVLRYIEKLPKEDYVWVDYCCLHEQVQPAHIASTVYTLTKSVVVCFHAVDSANPAYQVSAWCCTEWMLFRKPWRLSLSEASTIADPKDFDVLIALIRKCRYFSFGSTKVLKTMMKLQQERLAFAT